MDKWILIKDYSINLKHVRLIIKTNTSICFKFGKDYVGFSTVENSNNFNIIKEIDLVHIFDRLRILIPFQSAT